MAGANRSGYLPIDLRRRLTRLDPVLLVTVVVFLWFCATRASAAEPQVSSEQEKFFEEKVRPILVAKCQHCHGREKQESDLRMDSRATILAGGATGEPGAIAGNPDKSLIIQAVRHQGDFQMPPNENDKLTEEQIAVLTEWVKQELPWPKSAETPAAAITLNDKLKLAREEHWAFQPIAQPPLPAAADANWVRAPIDTFVAAKLTAKGLAPSSEADRRTLIRRLTYDLTGLPPTLEEVTAFEADEAPDAYERLVDQLLASPAYGERWGRHWLDVARYADTKGYAFGQERRFPYSYTYRDYVIRALNSDLPYDQFVVEQLAADLLPPTDDNLHLAALGFLTVGRKFNNQHDDIDDLIDVVGRGLVGLTVACARCHDHKYDAIPTEDYYSLYGVFASVQTPEEYPLIGKPPETAEYKAYVAELQKREAELEKYRAETRLVLINTVRQQSADYLAKLLAGSQEKLLENLAFLSLPPKDLRPRFIQRWQAYIKPRSKAEHPVWGAWHELASVPDAQFTEKSGEVLARIGMRPSGTETNQCNGLIKSALISDPPATRLDIARVYGKVLTEALQAWKQQGANADALGKLPPEQRQLAEVLVASESPTEIPAGDVVPYYNRAEREKDRQIQKKIDSFVATSAAAPARAMAVQDKPQPVQPRVFIRGNFARPGDQVPRQFLRVVAGEDRKPFTQGSGRLELAKAIVAPDNPLTRRVIVNRVWMHHFGEPLVDTPSDFGVRSEPPVYPMLLDYLATKLLDNGWSLKELHREILHSSTYRQASVDRPECREIDPENRLLWRMNRRRLEWEASRDSLLAVAGNIDLSVGGRPVELTGDKPSRRRTVYGFLDRQDLPGLFRVFDIASPDQSTPRRPQTTVPQQNLFLMNAPFVVNQAQALVGRLPDAKERDDRHRIAELYRLAFQREPAAEEITLGTQFIAAVRDDKTSKLTPWEQYAQLLLLTNEFMYVD